MRVYQAAELLDGLVKEIIDKIPRGHGKEIDNLRRTAASVPHNIAEAHGVDDPGRKRTHLQIARGSADETRSALRKFVRDGVVEERLTYRPNSISITVAKMLSAWIEALPRN